MLSASAWVQTRGVARPGLAGRNADTVGQLVWAKFPGGLWWPAEVLDPFHLPLGRSLPLGAVSGEERDHTVKAALITAAEIH